MRLIFVILVILATIFFSYWMLNSPPSIQPEPEPHSVGRSTPLKFILEDRSGLRGYRLWWEQNGKSIPIEEKDLGKARRQEISLVAGAGQQKELTDGQASLWMEATDAAWVRPKTRRLSWPVNVRTRPPQLAVLSGQHYINQGGTEMVVYRVSDTATWSGVRVGKREFPGFPLPGADAGTHFVLFAFPYNEPANTVPQLVARDEVGNEAITGFWYKLFPKKFRQRAIEVSDDFLHKVVPSILSHSNEVSDQGDLLKSFLAINGKLREVNNAFISQLASKSENAFLWSEPFSQLGNSQVEAQFADHRTYLYGGKEVDRQTHLGFDLSTVRQAPIAAANRGRVVYADWLGIYGNTVVLDHGYGLQTLYGHMSSIDVKPGDVVEKGQTLGRSGETGLAGGDHLHFSMLLHGEQINATEWWDGHWIHDRLLLKLPNKQLPGAPAAQPAKVQATSG